MLNSLRKSLDSIFLKAIIFLIVAAFILWGLSDIFNNKGDLDIAKFKYASAITRNELINAIRHKKGFSSNDANVDAKELAKDVLKDLAREKLIAYLADDLGIALDSKDLADIIKNFPELQNQDTKKNAKFDKDKFQNMLQRLGITQEQYIRQINKFATAEILHNVFNHSHYLPLSLTDAIRAFLAEERTVSVLMIDKEKIIPTIPNPTDIELQDFFASNLENFRLPEMRDIKYLFLDEEFFLKNKLLNKSDGKDVLKGLLIDYEKLLEEEVATGTSIDDIANKIHAKVESISKANLNDIINKKDISEFAAQIFELPAGELSYPFYLDGQKILLAQIEHIHKPHLPKLDEIKKRVTREFIKTIAHNQTQEILHKVAKKDITAEDFRSIGKKANSQILSKLKISKYLAPSSHNLPLELFSMLFMVPKNFTTSVYMDNNYWYLGYIDDIQTGQNQEHNIDRENIMTISNQGYLTELLQYIWQLNKVVLNYNDPIFQE
jgi:hypothetical protein